MSSTEHLELTIGNPENNAATFSRFVFPFAYKLEEVGCRHQALHYSQAAESDNLIARKKYLSHETVLVLFERARWLSIPESLWNQTEWGQPQGIEVNLKHGAFKVKMLPPQLVLFECPTGEIEEQGILQTGFLFVDIYFPDQANKPKLDDLLALNELFRYFDRPYPGHFTGYADCLGNVPISYGDSPNPVISSSANNEPQAYFDRWLNLLKIPVELDGNCYSLISPKAQQAATEWINQAKIKRHEDNNFLVHIDNRCYVWTAALLVNGGKALAETFPAPSQEFLAENYGHWIKLLNIDSPNELGSETNQKTGFETQWAKEKTYKRWESQGNWYGFNTHSGAMLAGVDPSHLCPVFRGQYFDQTLLLLYLRTTLFRLSRKLSMVVDSKHAEQGGINDKWLNDLRSLRLHFSRFTILYQFPSLSNQQQALEMYELARKAMDVDLLYQEVKDEIANTHDFLEQTEANSLSRIANILAEWGLPIASASVVISLFGVSNYQFLTCPKDGGCALPDMGIPLVLAVVVAWGVKHVITQSINKRTRP